MTDKGKPRAEARDRDGWPEPLQGQQAHPQGDYITDGSGTQMAASTWFCQGQWRRLESWELEAAKRLRGMLAHARAELGLVPPSSRSVADAGWDTWDVYNRAALQGMTAELCRQDLWTVCRIVQLLFASLPAMGKRKPRAEARDQGEPDASRGPQAILQQNTTDGDATQVSSFDVDSAQRLRHGLKMINDLDCLRLYPAGPITGEAGWSAWEANKRASLHVVADELCREDLWTVSEIARLLFGSGPAPAGE